MTKHGKSGSLGAANDNASLAVEPLDPRILRIAEAVGRQLAREQVGPPQAANDNNPNPAAQE